MEFTGERFIPHVFDDDHELAIEHYQRYYAIEDIVRNKIVLDAASGEGFGSFILAQSASQVYGVDISEEAINHAKERYFKSNLTFIVASIDQLPLEDQSVDVVVSYETIEHVNEKIQEKFMNEIKRVLKPKGLLVISTPNKYIYSDLPKYRNEFHLKEFYKEEFDDFLKLYFKNVTIYEQKFEVFSVLANDLFQDCKIINKPNKRLLDGKYIIAVCSDEDHSKLNLSSVIPINNKYMQMVNRIIELQNEIEDKNKHINILNIQITEQNKQIDEMNSRIEEKENQIEEKNNQIVELFNEISSLRESLFDKNVEIQNLQGHIHQLLEKERVLNNIYRSNGWRALKIYYKYRDKMFPPHSKRKFIVRMLIKMIRHPGKMINHINMTNIKKFLHYYKTENGEALNHRIDTFLEKHREQQRDPIKINSHKDTFEKLSAPQFENPIVSIIIPVYNQWKYTYSCIQSIIENTSDVPYEIIIADDNSTDETIQIDQLVENVRIVRDGINRGFLLNCNHASQFAKGKYIHFLNNDTNVQEGWLKSLVELIEQDPGIGMVGSKLIYPDGRLQEAGGIIWRDASGWNYGRLDDPEKPEYNYVKEVDYISGASILIRSELWHEIGGFDTRFVPAYFEDTDLAFEIRKRGYKVVYQPKSVVVHFEGVSHGTDLSSGLKSYQLKNKQKFLEKWNNILSNEHFTNGSHVFWARDRSKNKKTIVVIDHYVPHFDKDAGSRFTFHYLKLFVSLGFHVIFIGDNFYRHEPYTTKLEQLGVLVLYGSWYANNIKSWIIKNGKYFDYVYLNRPHISIKYMHIFKKYTNAKIIYFGHDLHYLRELRNYELEGNKGLLKSSDRWKEIEFKLFAHADVIHVVSSYEKDILIKEFPNKIIRQIPLYIFDQTTDTTSKKDFDDREGILFVGGFNHKPNVDGVKWFVDKIFPIICSKQSKINLTIVGSYPPDEIVTLQSERIQVTGFISDEDLIRYYNNSKIVIVPLRFGAGVKGKVIEALYHNVPIVSTSIGAEGLVDIEEVLLISDDEAEFADKVIELYNNSELWNSLSNKSQEYVDQYFSIDAAKNKILLDLNPDENN